MARREVVDCDCCGKHALTEPQRVYVEVDRSLDPSGNGYNTEGETFDLCPACLKWSVEQLLKILNDWDRNKKFLRELQSRRSNLGEKSR